MSMAKPESTHPQERLDRAMRDLFRDFFRSGPAMLRLGDTGKNPLHVEEFVEGDTGVIRVEMAGIDPERDVDITLQNGVLVINARREERTEEERPEGYRTEFRYGTFRRVVRLPENAGEADVKAVYRDGILEVRVPLTTPPETPPTKIPVARS
jgi:HSP20 family protein